MDFSKLHETFKDIDLKNIQKGVDEIMNKATPAIEGLMKEHQKILKPKSKKNIKFNGKNINMSLIEDGRIMLNFGSLDEAQTAYDKSISLEERESYETKISIQEDKIHELNTFLEFCHNKGLMTETKLSEMTQNYKDEISKPWYKKLFGK